MYYPGSLNGRHHYHNFYYQEEKNIMRHVMNRIAIKTTVAAWKVKNQAREALSNERGDFYISDGVKIIIAVVLGALLLAALSGIFNDTVIPRITSEIEALFG